MMSPINPGPKETRGILVPPSVVKWFSVGIVAVLGLGPIAFLFDICFWIAGDDWLNLVFPGGVIVFVTFSTCNMLLLARLGFRSGLGNLKFFWLHAILLFAGFVAVYALNIILLLRSPNHDIFSFYLIITIVLTGAAPLAGIFIISILRNRRWFSPAYWLKNYGSGDEGI